MDETKPFKIERPRTFKEFTDFFSRPEDEEWIELCKSDFGLYYKLRFKNYLELALETEHLIKLYEGGTKIPELQKTSLEGIGEAILLGRHSLNKARKALSFLQDVKYLTEDQIKDFNTQLDQIQEIILNYTRKYANVVRL